MSRPPRRSLFKGLPPSVLSRLLSSLSQGLPRSVSSGFLRRPPHRFLSWLPHRLAPCLASGLLGCLACGQEPHPCGDPTTENDPARAAEVCTAHWQETGSADAGAAAARAAYLLCASGDEACDEEEVLAWPERLAGTPKEGAALTFAALLHRQRGEPRKEEAALERSAVLFGAHGEAARQAWSLYSLGYLAWEESRYQEALDRAVAAEEAARRGGDRSLEKQALGLQHTVLYAVGDLEGARWPLETLDSLARETPASDPRSRLEEARHLHQKANLSLEAGRLALARRDAEAALETGRGVEAEEGQLQEEKHRLLRAIHLNLAQIALRRGEASTARDHVEQAWTFAEAGGERTALLFYRARVALAEGRPAQARDDLQEALAADPVADWAWELELDLGEAWEALGNLDEAERAYRRSAAVVEALRSSLDAAALKPSLIERKRRPFEALFRLLVDQGRTREALEVTERARGRTFLEALAGASPREGPAQLHPLREASRRLAGLEALLPALQHAGAAPFSAAELQEALEDVPCLVFFEAEGVLWRLALLQSKDWGTATWHRVQPTAAEVEEAVDAFLADLDDEGQASRLGAALLGPPQGPLRLPPLQEPLHLLVDGALGRLPFAALRLPGGEGEAPLLAGRASFAFVPSLGGLASLRLRPQEARAGTLIAADSRGDLPEARQEAREVAGIFGEVRVLTGREVSRPALQRAWDVRLLHLATHTGLGPQGPWIALAEGELAAAALLEQGPAPPLTVLATCASAARPGRALWGSLGAAFLAAGSETVVASLTSVADDDARRFVLAFYRAGGAHRPAQALAQVQGELAASGRPAQAWAPFVTLGHGIHGAAAAWKVGSSGEASTISTGTGSPPPGEP